MCTWLCFINIDFVLSDYVNAFNSYDGIYAQKCGYNALDETFGTASAVIALDVLATFAPQTIPVVAEKVAEALIPLAPLVIGTP